MNGLYHRLKRVTTRSIRKRNRETFEPFFPRDLRFESDRLKFRQLIQGFVSLKIEAAEKLDNKIPRRTVTVQLSGLSAKPVCPTSLRVLVFASFRSDIIIFAR